MKWWRAVREMPTILAMEALETSFSKSIRGFFAGTLEKGYSPANTLK
jgi:hypothetical protein